MQSFRFLKLPDIVRDQVLRVADDFDRIVFSLISRKTKNLVKHANCSVKKLHWQLFDRPNASSLDLSDRSFGFSIEEVPAGEDSRRTQLMMNGDVYPAVHTSSFLTFQLDDFTRPFRHPWKLMEEMTKHVLEVCRCEEFGLRACTESENLFVFEYTRRFDNLSYTTGTAYLRSSSRLSRFLLQDLEVTGAFNFFLFPEEGFVYNDPLRMGSYMAEADGFLTKEAVFNMECRRATFTVQWNDEELNEFLMKWLTGGLQNLEECHFSGPDEFDIDTLFEGIPTIPFSLDNRPRRYTGDRSEGWDIRRNDGCLATIDIDEELVLTIYVWKELMGN